MGTTFLPGQRHREPVLSLGVDFIWVFHPRGFPRSNLASCVGEIPLYFVF